MKSRLIGCLVLAAVALWACELPRPRSPSTSDATQPASTTSATAATYLAPTEGGCYYVWTSQELPAVSKSVDSGLQAINPQMTGSAYEYGEDCVFADATRTFTALETDFRVRVQVIDLKDQTKIGDSVALAMNVIGGIPAERLHGAQPGRVDFEFFKSDTEALNLSVGIERYRRVAPGTSGANLFRLLYAGP